MGAGGGSGDPVYHYHSNYDTYHWMSNFGDPGFLAHKYMAKVSIPSFQASERPTSANPSR